MKKIGLLKNPVQEYAWGSRTFIPELLGEPSPSKKPKAELWIGAHPKGSSQVLLDGDWIPLGDLIQKDPDGILGKPVAKKFANKLPFLFKVLAAARPLSIQAHPDLTHAREGFRRENGMNIPLEAPHRNYRDGNHKPELICALSPFWVLTGFRRPKEIIAFLAEIGVPSLKIELDRLKAKPDFETLRDFFTDMMMMDKERKSRIVSEVIEGMEGCTSGGPEFEWVSKLNQAFPGDIGVLAPLILRMTRLRPTEAMPVSVGELHAYLDGAAIELMANSDNVLRGGLTSKHMDVPELLKILKFPEKGVDILRAERLESGESVYPTEAEEFVLSEISTREGSFYESPRQRSVEMMICTDGSLRMTDLGNGDVLSLEKGTALLVPASVEQYRIDGQGTLYKAAVPLDYAAVI